MSTYDIGIIGGGIIGASIAFETGKAGLSTFIIEKSFLGAEASTAAAGMLHAQAEGEGNKEFLRLLIAARNYYKTFRDSVYEITPVDMYLEEKGILRPFLDEDDKKNSESFLNLQKELGEQYELIDAKAMKALEPALKDDLPGGIYFKNEMHVNTFELMNALQMALVPLNVPVMSGNPVAAIKRVNGEYHIAVKEKTYVCKKLVIAAGAWSDQILNMIGLSLPMTAVKGQMMIAQATDDVIHRPVFYRGGYIVPRFGFEILAGSTIEPDDFNKNFTFYGAHAITQSLAKVAPSILKLPVEKTWAGLRPKLAGSDYPVFGKISMAEDVYISTGHYKNGIILGPHTSKIVADQIIKGGANTAGFDPDKVVKAK